MLTKAKLPIILTSLLKSNHLTETDLARQTGLGQPVVHRIASGVTGNPKMETLRPIANYFGLTINQLIGDEPFSKDKLPSLNLGNAIKSWNQVPLLSFEQALNWPKIKVQASDEKIATDLDLSTEAFALTLKDSTMSPRFPEGTIIIVDPEYQPNDQDFVVVRFSHLKQVCFRQFLLDGPKIYLKALNPDFKTTMMDKKSTVLGVMIEARTSYAKTKQT